MAFKNKKTPRVYIRPSIIRFVVRLYANYFIKWTGKFLSLLLLSLSMGIFPWRRSLQVTRHGKKSAHDIDVVSLPPKIGTTGSEGRACSYKHDIIGVVHDGRMNWIFSVLLSVKSYLFLRTSSRPPSSAEIHRTYLSVPRPRDTRWRFGIPQCIFTSSNLHARSRM